MLETSIRMVNGFSKLTERNKNVVKNLKDELNQEEVKQINEIVKKIDGMSKVYKEMIVQNG